jgi:hypothetical protein
MFDSIRNAENSFAEVQKFIANRTSEDEFLEFKGGRIDDNAVKKYWSQALSGFANTGGGMVVFGVSTDRVAQPDGGRAIDTAVAQDLLSNPNQLIQLLKDVRLSATTDLVQGVDYLPVVGTDGKGFAVCLVPEGNQKPYKAELDPSRNYFQRVGDNFVLLSHSLLRSLFYPRLAPKLKLFARVSDRKENMVEITFSVRNDGVATARDMAIAARMSVPVRTTSNSNDWRMHLIGEPALSFRANALHPLHPGDTITPFPIGVSQLEYPGFQLSLSVHMADQEPVHFRHQFLVTDISYDNTSFEVSQTEKRSAEDI